MLPLKLAAALFILNNSTSTHNETLQQDINPATETPLLFALSSAEGQSISDLGYRYRLGAASRTELDPQIEPDSHSLEKPQPTPVDPQRREESLSDDKRIKSISNLGYQYRLGGASWTELDPQIEPDSHSLEESQPTPVDPQRGDSLSDEKRSKRHAQRQGYFKRFFGTALKAIGHTLSGTRRRRPLRVGVRRRVVVRRPAIVRGKRDAKESLKERTKRHLEWLRPSVARRRVVVRRPTLVRSRPIFAPRPLIRRPLLVRRVIGRRPAILVRGKRSTQSSVEPLKRQKRNIQVGPISVTSSVRSSGEKVQRICLNLSQEERNCVIVNQKSGEKAFVTTELTITGKTWTLGADSGYRVIVTENSIEIENDRVNILSLGPSFTKVQAGPLSVTPTNGPSGEKVRNICVKQSCVSVSQKAGRNNFVIYTFEVTDEHKLCLSDEYCVVVTEDNITVSDGQRTNISFGRGKRSVPDHNRRKISDEPRSEKSHNAEVTTPRQTFEGTDKTSWIHPYQQTNAHSYTLPEDVKHQEVITTKTGSNLETDRSAESDETESVEREKRFIKIHQGPEGQRICYNTGACISQGPWGQVITYPSGKTIQQQFWGQNSEAKISSRRSKRSNHGPQGRSFSIKGNGFDVSVVPGKRSIKDASENTSPNQKSQEPASITDSYGQPRKNFATYRFKIGSEPEPEGPPEGEFWAAVDAYRVPNNPLISLKQKLLDPVYAKLYKIHPLLHPDYSFLEWETDRSGLVPKNETFGCVRFNECF